MFRIDSARRFLIPPLLVFLISQAANAETVLGYEPEADVFELVQKAQAQAADEGKYILLMAGGDWCIWCHYLQRFLDANDDISGALKHTFVVAKAYYGDEEYNSEYFSTIPSAAGYPHFWILDANGEVLESQNTLPLEDGDKSYDRENFIAFIDKWESARTNSVSANSGPEPRR